MIPHGRNRLIRTWVPYDGQRRVLKYRPYAILPAFFAKLSDKEMITLPAFLILPAAELAWTNMQQLYQVLTTLQNIFQADT
jgi:hypothetical protein